jgi:prepilin peptidase CpaA
MSATIVTIALLLPLAVIITYHDVRYRRIPNAYVLSALLGGVAINGLFGGVSGLASSLGGCALAFGLMFMLHVFGAMGAGDVKLFAAIGAVTGLQLVLPTFLIVVLTGGLLAMVTVLRNGVLLNTMHRVLQILVGMLPGWEMPKFAIPTDRSHTIPYGVAITLGSIISTAVFRAY